MIDLSSQLTWDGTNNDTLSTIENAIGSSFDDIIRGDVNNNVLDGGAGGADHIDGGAGSDTVSYANSGAGVVIDLASQLTWDGTNNDALSSIENAIGSKFDDIIRGDDGNNVLDGGAGGADHIDGGAGSDTVSYASSASAISIDLASQVTWDGSVNDTLSSIENAIGSNFDDTIVGDAGDNLLDGGTGGADHIAGGDGRDTVSYAHSATGVVIDLDAQVTWDGSVNDTLSSIESAIGSSHDDIVQGSVIDGAHFDGGLGCDTLSFASSTQGVTVVDGYLSSSGGIVTDGIGTESFSGFETIVGSAGNDVFDSVNHDIARIDGGAGVDTFSVAGQGVVVTIDLDAQAVSNTVPFVGSSLPASYYVDIQLSSIENAVGSAGNDTLVASSSGTANVLTGGDGSDTFAFKNGFGHDTITDFAAGGARDVTQLDHGLFVNDDPLLGAQDVGDDVVLSVSDHADITLLGLHKADLSMSDFHFV